LAYGFLRGRDWEAEVDGGPSHLDELLLRGGKACLESVDFAEPSALVGFRESFSKAGDDVFEALLLGGVWAQCHLG